MTFAQKLPQIGSRPRGTDPISVSVDARTPEEVDRLFKAINSRLHREDEGFTLIELMVVVLIIAILIAIAIPTFLGARTKAQDRAAQSALRQSLLTAKSFYTDNETYVTTGVVLHGLEPSVVFDETIGNATNTTTGFTGTATTVVMERQSKSGSWFCIADDVSVAPVGAGTTYGKGAAKTDVDTFAECQAASW